MWLCLQKLLLWHDAGQNLLLTVCFSQRATNEAQRPVHAGTHSFTRCCCERNYSTTNVQLRS